MSHAPNSGDAREASVQTSRSEPSEHQGRAARRPYEPPRVTFHEPLEGFAAICSPGKADPIMCPLGPIAS